MNEIDASTARLIDRMKEIGATSSAQRILDQDAEIRQLRAKLETSRAALKASYSWLDRWAVHAGRCGGGGNPGVCTCGLSAVKYEVSVAIGDA